jgi:hypothetical protein
MFSLDQILSKSLLVSFRAQLKSDLSWVTFYDYRVNEQQNYMFNGLDFEGNKIFVSLDEILVNPPRIDYSISSLESKIKEFENALDVLKALKNTNNKENLNDKI